MDVLRCFLSMLLGVYALTAQLQAQDQSGFISIDCGISADSGYTDATTGINYISDETFIETGISNNISPEFNISTLEKQFWKVRSFPQGTRNCYTLKPQQVQGYKYLIRASFMYGNYDAQNKLPEFDLHLGVNLWDSVEFNEASQEVIKEIIHVPSSNYTDVCLVNKNLGTVPFISVLELRLLKDTVYVTETGSLALLFRLDFGATTNQIRFKEDVYDRIWTATQSEDFPELEQIDTSLTIDETTHTDFQPPSAVMSTASKPKNAGKPLEIHWEPPESTSQIYFYFHFCELEELQDNQTREFNIYLNGQLWHPEPCVPNYLYSTTIYSIIPESEETFEFSINKTEKSTLPPIINAFEIYMVKQLSQSQTDQQDVDAIKNIKLTYGVKKNWQGDPCAPQAYLWDGLNCSYNGFDPPRIISLNLFSSELSGEISPYISNLKLIQHLDLSNNNLTGPMPDFLSHLPFLTVLNLTGNNLTGSVPAELIERSKDESLSLSVGENPNLCSNVSCEMPKKKKNIVIPVVASVAALFILLAALAIWWSLKLRKQQEGKVAKVVAKSNKRDEVVETKNQYTYSEVSSITNNFRRVLGKGGFGTVYHGYLNGNQVAVKMLSESSMQGYKQFQAEVKLLMRVHHKNLTSLVGYCDEGENMGLIYEYMANGNLQEHLSDRNPYVLSWEERLSIAVDAAQGLEYLHNGCKPPMIHRDVKSSNILVNEKFQAKVADFGLSRVFPIEESSHVSTTVVGTPGYLDPEYNVSNRLNERSDVFGFGVVLLEIITSQPVIIRTQEMTHISKWVSVMLATKGDVRDVVDPRLRDDYDTNSAWKAVEIALACVSVTSIKRPTMNHVAAELKQCLSTEMGRKDGRENESKDSIEMLSLNLDSELTPFAR